VITRGRVTGVRLPTADGPHKVGLDEVVLSTSAIGSPSILLLSGSAPPTSCAASGWMPPSAALVRRNLATRCSGWCCSRTGAWDWLGERS
jgi:hypothetical protein